MDAGAIYHDTRVRISELVRGLTADQLALRVPACPGWTVQQLLAHLVGVAADIVDGNLEEVASEPWTSAQVEARAGRTAGDLLTEWDAVGGIVERMVDGLPSRSRARLLTDLATHEQDLRSALGEARDRDSAGARTARESYYWALQYRIRRAGLPALRLHSEEDDRVLGEGEPAAAVTAPAFDLERATAGRRSLRQIRAFTWEGDAESYIPLFPNFDAPHEDVVE